MADTVLEWTVDIVLEWAEDMVMVLELARDAGADLAMEWGPAGGSEADSAAFLLKEQLALWTKRH